MSFVYYCKKCRSVYTGEKDNEIHYCPECHNGLAVTHYSGEDWRTKNQDEKDELKREFDKNGIKSKPSSPKPNSTGQSIKAVGTLFLALSVFGGIYFMKEIRLETGIAVISIGLVESLLLIGFGEIIILLQGIRDK